MKKMTAVMGLVLASSAVAQSWEANDGKLTLIGCYGKQDGVYCDFSYTLTKKQTAKIYWSVTHFKVFKQDGISQNANAVAFAGGKSSNYNSSSVEVIANVPVKLQVYFNLPNTTTGFRAITYRDQRLENVQVRPYGSNATVPAQLTAPINVDGYSISLSDCKLQGAEYACSAKATPNK